jgi:hypothetical protein
MMNTIDGTSRLLPGCPKRCDDSRPSDARVVTMAILVRRNIESGVKIVHIICP